LRRLRDRLPGRRCFRGIAQAQLTQTDEILALGRVSRIVGRALSGDQRAGSISGLHIADGRKIVEARIGNLGLIHWRGQGSQSLPIAGDPAEGR